MIIAIDARPLIHTQIQGLEQRARNILAAWARMPPQHEFHLLYPRAATRAREAQGETDGFDESLLATLPNNFHRVEIANYRFPTAFPTGSRVLNALARAVRGIKADVYHAFTLDVPRIITCPVVPTVHDLSFELDPVVTRTPTGKMQRRSAKRAMEYGQRIIAVSAQTKYDIASVYGISPDVIDVIYNGIDPAFSPPPATDLPTPKPMHLANGITGQYLLAVGADIPRRNYARMLAAMHQVWATPEGARAKWVLAGRADWKISDIYAAAREKGVLDRMRFVHNPNNAELADLYRGARLTCCASSFEGFGLSVLESMACGTAVACSDMRSLREVADDAAVYFPHDDAPAMGEAIAGLLDDAEYRRQLKCRGIYRASLFTWETAAELTLKSLALTCGKVAAAAPVGGNGQ